jgi:hypothetical protein
MSSGQTPDGQDHDRPSEPVDRDSTHAGMAPEPSPDLFDADAPRPGGPDEAAPSGSAEGNAAAWELVSKRLASAAAAAALAATGEAAAEPPGPLGADAAPSGPRSPGFSSPETDAAVAAAAAAAAAAVAAVNAAIAATAAANASRAATAAAAAKAQAAPEPETPETPDPQAAQDVAALEAPEPAAPEPQASEVAASEPEVAQDVAALEAPETPSPEVTAPDATPASSAPSDTPPVWPAPVEWPPRTSFPATAATPDPSPLWRSPYAPPVASQFDESLPAVGAEETAAEEPLAVPPMVQARIVEADATGLAGEAVPTSDGGSGSGSVLLRTGRLLSMPVDALRNRLVRTDRSGSPDFDEHGNPHRERRVAPFWLWFAGFYIVVALTVAATLVFTGAGLPGSGPAASQSAGSTFAVSPSTSGLVPSASVAIGPTAVASPSGTALSSAPLLAVKEQPPSLQIGKNATFVVQFTPGATCTLTRTFVPGFTPAPPPTPKSSVSSLSFTIGTGGSATIAWGETAEAGTYSITAICTGSTRPSAPVTFTWS